MERMELTFFRHLMFACVLIPILYSCGEAVEEDVELLKDPIASTASKPLETGTFDQILPSPSFQIWNASYLSDEDTSQQLKTLYLSEDSVLSFSPPEGLSAQYSSPIYDPGQLGNGSVDSVCGSQEFSDSGLLLKDLIDETIAADRCGMVEFFVCVRVFSPSLGEEGQVYVASPTLSLPVPCKSSSFEDVSLSVNGTDSPYSREDVGELKVHAGNFVSQVSLGLAETACSGPSWKESIDKFSDLSFEWDDQGTDTVYVKLKNIVDLESDCLELKVTKDDQAPVISGLSLDMNPVSDPFQTPQISWNGESDVSGIAGYQIGLVKGDDISQSLIPYVFVGSDATSAGLTLPNGLDPYDNYRYSIVALDKAGNSSSPFLSPNFYYNRRIKHIEGTLSRICVVVEDEGMDKVKCWGWRAQYGLDQDLTDPMPSAGKDTGFVKIPYSVEDGIEEIQVSVFTYCARYSSGILRCWGSNRYGSLGQDAAGHLGSSPDNEAARSLIDPNNPDPAVVKLGDPSQLRKSCIVGENGMCALLSVNGQDEIRCWGYGNVSGRGDALHKGGAEGDMASLTPVKLINTETNADIDSFSIKDLSCGRFHACAHLELTYADSASDLPTERIKCWGYNRVGALGSEIPVISSAQEFIGDSSDEVYENMPFVPLNGNVKQLSTSWRSTCAMVEAAPGSSDLEVYCWGEWQEIGSGGTENIGNNVGDISSLSPVNLGATKPKKLFSGDESHCVLSTESRVYCWGLNKNFQLGTAKGEEISDDNAIHSGRVGSTIGDSPDEMGDNLLETSFGVDFFVEELFISQQHLCALGGVGPDNENPSKNFGVMRCYGACDSANGTFFGDECVAKGGDNIGDKFTGGRLTTIWGDAPSEVGNPLLVIP